jgi:hypothetical protein
MVVYSFGRVARVFGTSHQSERRKEEQHAQPGIEGITLEQREVARGDAVESP